MAIPKDVSWIRRSFVVQAKDLPTGAGDVAGRIHTSARLKYTDTRPGGNVCINPPAQFTRHADPKIKGVLNKSDGMGRYYSEAIDDHNQIIHIRCGVPQFNSMTNFFTGFYNSTAGQVARTGRGDSVFYTAGKAIGFVVQLASWKLLTVHFLGAAVNALSKKPSSKFYYSKPAMPLYWNAVTTIVNHMAVNRGVVPRMFGDASQQMDTNYKFDDAARKHLASVLPDIFDEGGGVNVYAIATQAKRYERQRMLQIEQVMDNAEELGITDMQALIRQIYSTPMPITNGTGDLGAYLQKWFDTDQSKPKAVDSEGSSTETVADLRGEDGKKSTTSIKEFLTAEMDDAAAFASFRVNATGPVSEGFSNSAGESELSSKLNGISAQARNAQFSFAEGNLIGGPVGDVLGGIVRAVKDVGRGILDSVQLSGLATLSGAAFADIPKHYMSSAANLTPMSYTIDLVSPFGNVVNQLINLDIPLAMLLAMALPKSTGLQSYTAPFLCEIFDRGRCQSRLAMVDSLRITRGTGNIGFNADGKALGYQVSISFIDMSSIMHMPISENFSFVEGAAQAIASVVSGGSDKASAVATSLTGGAFDEDTVFSDYLAVLAGMALNDQIYGLRKLKLALTRKAVDYKTWKSNAHIASFLGDTFPMRFASAFYRGTDKR